jgi:hypothetical protein
MEYRSLFLSNPVEKEYFCSSTPVKRSPHSLDMVLNIEAFL